MSTSKTIVVWLTVMSIAAPASALAHESLQEGVSNVIGRLNYAGYRKRRHCTITLIAAHTALTAAHCLEDVPPKELHVLLGYSKGKWVEHRRVIRLVVPKKRQDLALVCLKKPSRQQPLQLMDRTAAEGPVVLAGYARSRAHALAHSHCTAKTYQNQLVLDCPAERGFSGGPLLVETSKGWRVAGVMSKSGYQRSVAERVDPQTMLCEDDR